MDYTELPWFVNEDKSLKIENCRILITISNSQGKQTLHIDFITPHFDNYDKIQQFLVEKDVEYLEHYSEEMKMTCTLLKIDTELTLLLANPRQE